jgi:hypothetical protein
MTLNITLAARWLMAQSSDFRLTVDGKFDPKSSPAQKQVVLHYMGWSGLICYTGVASYGSHDTARWLGQILTHDAAPRTPGQVIERIRKKGNIWLRRVPAKYRRHTFTMITYEAGAAHIYLISSYEQLGRAELAVPANSFLVSHARVRGTTCVVTGWPSAVTTSQRSELERILAADPPPGELRHAIALASRESSHRTKDHVGEECVVAHLRPDGSGEAQVFGNLEAEFLPALILNGVNMGPPALRQAGIPRPTRLVGVTWASNGEVNGMAAAYRELSKQSGSGWPDEKGGGGMPALQFVREP